jgi:protein TonB
MGSFLLALLLGAAPLAVAPAPPLRVIEHPQWTQTPTASGYHHWYPAAAMERGIQGGAVVRCVVTADGGLADCVVTSETPSGVGFGKASLRLVAQYRMAPQTPDGQSVAGAFVIIPVNWRLDIVNR